MLIFHVSDQAIASASRYFALGARNPFATMDVIVMPLKVFL
jgi:hypothetical protein